MKKYVYIAPDLETAEQAVTTMKGLGVEEDRISAAASEKTTLGDIPPLDYLEKNDAIPAIKRGVGLGAATGFLVGLTAAVVAPAGIAIGGAGLVATSSLAGASFGTFVSAIVGSSVPHSQLDDFQTCINNGNVLLVVDLEESEADEIERLIGLSRLDIRDEGPLDAVPPIT